MDIRTLFRFRVENVSVLGERYGKLQAVGETFERSNEIRTHWRDEEHVVVMSFRLIRKAFFY